jgi:hypothetical protein
MEILDKGSPNVDLMGSQFLFESLNGPDAPERDRRRDLNHLVARREPGLRHDGM